MEEGRGVNLTPHRAADALPPAMIDPNYRLVEDQPPAPYKESRVESASLPWRPNYVI